MISVSNSSPLIGLEQIGKLEILEVLYGTIAIPPAVEVEVRPSVSLPHWIKITLLNQNVGPTVLAASLGAGESEAISLALEIPNSQVILDDLPARTLARALGLNVTGTLGILMLAKEQGVIPCVRECLDALMGFSFRVSPNLYELVLSKVGEAP